MTLPSIVPAEFDGTDADFAKTNGVDRSGAARIQAGSVTVASGTAANTYVGLIPFNKGARFNLHDTSVHVANIGAATTTVNIGYIYDSSDLTDDPDAFASSRTTIQGGGFIPIDEEEGLTFEAEGNGWLVAQILTAATDAEGDFTFNVVQAYG